MGLRVFPVEGGAVFTDDFGADRPGGRSHHGNDLFAPEGTPVLAVDEGTVAGYVDPLGGNAILLHATDGVTYYFAHLQRWERTSGRVAVGEVIGYVGRTGNAIGTHPHLHFEVHPGGGPAIDPFPLLERAKDAGPAGAANDVPPPSPRGVRRGALEAASVVVVAAVGGIILARRRRT